MSGFELFVKSTVPKGSNHHSNRERKLRLLIEENTCPLCGVDLTDENSSIDHHPSRLMSRASFGKLKSGVRLTCLKCNNNNKIQSDVGKLFMAPTLGEIRLASTALCDLVRKNKCS